MVLWEISLATAYFLGLKRTYKLALKIQRRLIPPKHPRIRNFAHRRTRAIFDVALRVHRNIQERDLEVGRNLGNRILRWLDRMKPSANIRGPPEEKLPGTNNFTSSVTKLGSNYQKSHDNIQKFSSKKFEWGSDRHSFAAARNRLPSSFSSIAMVMRPPRAVGSATQCRQLYSYAPVLSSPTFDKSSFGGILRKDIVQWLQQN